MSMQTRFMFSDPDGRFRRLCHVLPARFCCSLDLPGTWSFRGYSYCAGNERGRVGGTLREALRGQRWEGVTCK